MHVKSVEAHHTRALLTSRKVMQRKCIDLENEIRGILKVFGVKLPMRLSRGAFDDAVRGTIESDPALSHALLPMLQARGALFDTFLELDRRVKRKAREDAVCRRFMGVPGWARSPRSASRPRWTILRASRAHEPWALTSG